MKTIDELKSQAIQSIQAALDVSVLELIRVEYFGKKGKLTQYLKEMTGLRQEEKPRIGQILNQAKNEILELIEIKRATLKEEQLNIKLASEKIDVTLPGRSPGYGSIHPVNQIKQYVIDFFSNLGFDTVLGPEIETDFYNFAALNIPAAHPARAMH